MLNFLLGNFFHYGSQRRKTDPPPANPDQNWKKWIEDTETPMGEGGSLSMFSPLIDKNKLDTINQPMYEDMDDEEEMVNISIQPVNTIKTSYIYSPIPRRVRQVSISSPSKLPPIWSM